MARTGWGQMGYQITTGSNDPSKVISKDRWNLPVSKGTGILGFDAQTVASASTITPNRSVVILTGSTEVTKFLITDSEEYDIIWVFKGSGASCALTNTTGTPNADGQIVGLGSASTIALSETSPKIFIRKSNGSHQLWMEYGGSGTAAASELTGTTLATNVITSSLTTVAALNAGSITSGFGNINIGSSNFTTTGTVTCDVTGDLTGNADTATTSTNVTLADESTDTACNVLFATAATGSLPPKTGTNLTFNSNTGILTASGFAGDITGDVTGDVSGSSGSTTGNAATATTAGTVTGAAQTAITSVGTLTTLEVDNVTIDGNKIEVTNTDGNLQLDSDGTGVIEVLGNTNDGAITLNCTANSHGQTIKSQPHGQAQTNTMLLPKGASSTLVSLVSADTLTNKTLTSPVINVGSDASGDVYYRNSSGVLTRLAKPASPDGEVLTFANGASIPSWASAGGGSDTPWSEVHNFAGFYYDMTVQTKPANPAVNAGRFYVKEIDSNNDGLFCLIRKNATDFVEVQIV